MFLLLVGALAADTSPQLSAISVDHGSYGMCDGINMTPSEEATIVVSWTATNFDSSLHEFKVYQNGVLVSTQSTQSYTKTMTSRVVDGPRNQLTTNYAFNVKLVLKSSGAVLVSKTSAVWAVTYGSCQPSL